jgi:hypothetical protein
VGSDVTVSSQPTIKFHSSDADDFYYTKAFGVCSLKEGLVSFALSWREISFSLSGMPNLKLLRGDGELGQ